jgi:hypothetical protein
LLIKLQLYTSDSKKRLHVCFCMQYFWIRRYLIHRYCKFVKHLICRCKTGWEKWIVIARTRDLSWEVWKVEKYMSLPLDILVTKYIKLITKNQFLLLFFSTSSKGYNQIISKKPNTTILSLLKNPRNFAEKRKISCFSF